MIDLAHIHPMVVHFPLAHGHGWAYWWRPAGKGATWVVSLGAVGALALGLVTGYYGGNLVYGIGVNVQPVVAETQH